MIANIIILVNTKIIYVDVKIQHVYHYNKKKAKALSFDFLVDIKLAIFVNFMEHF